MLVDDCFLHDRERLTHDEAISLIMERVGAVAGVETVALEHAARRILAEDVAAPRDVPGFTNAAVDGYAFAHASLGASDTRLKVTMRIAAMVRLCHRKMVWLRGMTPVIGRSAGGIADFVACSSAALSASILCRGYPAASA